METAIGVFNSRDRAEKALKELLHRDVPEESIVFLTTSETEAASLAIEFGALAGGVAGGAAGVTSALVVTTLFLIPGFGQALALGIGATALLGLAGAGVGSVAAKAASTDRTIPQPMPDNRDAELFRNVLKEGRSLIIVRTNYHDVASAACAILDRMGLSFQQPPNLKMHAATREVGDVSVVGVSGRITLGEGNVILRDIIRGLIREGKTKIVLNLAGVEHIDSAPPSTAALGQLMPKACAAIAPARRVVPAHSNPMVSAIAVAVPAPLRKARRVARGGMRVRD